MLRFRAFLIERTRAPLTLDQVKACMEHVPNNSLLDATWGGFFILPDGTVWRSGTSHHDAFEKFLGSDSTDPAFYKSASLNGLVLAHSARAYECTAPITAAQASRIVGEYGMTNPPGAEPLPMFVDCSGVEGETRNSKTFDERVKADPLRAWVRAQF